MDINQIKDKIFKDPILLILSNLAKEKNIPLFLVGGYLRDLLLGMEGSLSRHSEKDYDFTLPRDASFFVSMMEEALHFRFFKVGKEDTLTYRITKKEWSFDLTFFQGTKIEDDLQRRDFTINAIAFSLRDETFHWVEGTLEDIKKRAIRTVSNHSIDQDPLRMLRAFRYLCSLDGFVIMKELIEEIHSKTKLIEKLPGERIKMELDHILLSPQPALGMRFLYESNLLFTLFPELKGIENLGQNEHHHIQVLSHTLLMIEKIPQACDWIASHQRKISLEPDDLLSLYYAALFHDIGKQNTFSKDEKGRVHFYHHESFSCKAAEEIMKRLRFSNLMRNKVLHLIQNHMRILNLSHETKDTALKRLVNQMADETPLLVLHTLADKEASRGILTIQIDEVVENHCLRVLELFQQQEIVHPPPLINGHDLMSLNYLPGPLMGQLLKFIRDKQVEGEIKTREDALRMIMERYNE
jgi:putative nucleotidyltransferase with HDIG domain